MKRHLPMRAEDRASDRPPHPARITSRRGRSPRLRFRTTTRGGSHAPAAPAIRPPRKRPSEGMCPGEQQCRSFVKGIGRRDRRRRLPKCVAATSTAQSKMNITRAATGQFAKLARHQGSIARRANSLATRDSSVPGARRGGSPLKAWCNTCSSFSVASVRLFIASAIQCIARTAHVLQQRQKCRPRAANVGFDLGQ